LAAIFNGQAATLVLTLAALSVAVPLKLMVAGTVTGTVADAASAIEPLKASGASCAKGTAILDASTVTAASLTSAG